MHAPVRERLTWLDDAACRRMDRDPELWFPDGAGARPNTASRAALGICEHCPVKQECLDLALTLEGTAETGRYGIWGGLGPQARGDLVWMRAAIGRKVGGG